MKMTVVCKVAGSYRRDCMYSTYIGKLTVRSCHDVVLVTLVSDAIDCRRGEEDGREEDA